MDYGKLILFFDENFLDWPDFESRQITFTNKNELSRFNIFLLQNCQAFLRSN